MGTADTMSNVNSHTGLKNYYRIGWLTASTRRRNVIRTSRRVGVYTDSVVISYISRKKKKNLGVQVTTLF